MAPTMVVPPFTVRPGFLRRCRKQWFLYTSYAKKAKTAEGLTEEELKERDILRREYIDSFKRSLVGQLENTYIVDEKGNKTKVTRKEKKQ